MASHESKALLLGPSALADKPRILPKELKDKFCDDEFCFLCCIYTKKYRIFKKLLNSVNLWILGGHIYNFIVSLMERQLENYSTFVGCPGWMKIVSLLILIGWHFRVSDLLIRQVAIICPWIKTSIAGIHLKLKL